jgi:hypothetical protein
MESYSTLKDVKILSDAANIEELILKELLRQIYKTKLLFNYDARNESVI